MIGRRILAHLLVIALGGWTLNGWAGVAMANPTGPWRPVQPGKRKGISGLAWVRRQDEICEFLAVHDNKGESDQPRLALLEVPAHGAVRYHPLAWPVDVPLPVDLEALSRVPNAQGEFMAVTSLGLAYRIRLDIQTRTVTVLDTVQIPPHTGLTNIEGFGLHAINDQLVAVWAHRGEDADPGVLFWGRYYPEQAKIVADSSTEIQVPWPTQQVRHVSDLKVAPDGVLYITAASDPGEQGPFASATYAVGRFPLGSGSSTGAQPQVPSREGLVPIYRSTFNKVEALEIIPGERGGIVLASDDEKFGSSLAGAC